MLATQDYVTLACFKLWKTTQPAYILCTALAIDFLMFLPISYISMFIVNYTLGHIQPLVHVLR